MADALLADIGKSHELKHVETTDKSAPVIENVEIKKNDRGAFLAEVAAEHNLKHAETVDKSAPVISADVHVGESKRPALLAEIQAKKTE